MIEARELVRTYGRTTAVDGLSFSVRPGVVTGFLGPNGAGKSTTMRMILGLDSPTQGTVKVNGRPYRDMVAPMREVGALLDARAVHPGRSAYHHLVAQAQTHGIGRARVRQVLELVGLEDVAHRRAGAFSLGMGQRLGLANALLGDPPVILLDEPVNGLDPDGILWIRQLLRSLAAQGRTVLLSSHLMSEMALTADRLLVIGRGRLLADTSVDDLISQAGRTTVRVASPQAADLAVALRTDLSRHGVEVQLDSRSEMTVTGVPASAVGDVAGAHGCVLHELIDVRPTLEAAYMNLTREAVDYVSNLTVEGVPTSERVA